MAKLNNGTTIRFVVEDFKWLYESCLENRDKATGVRILLDKRGFVVHSAREAVASCDLSQANVDEYITEYERVKTVEGGNTALMATKLIRFVLKRLD